MFKILQPKNKTYLKPADEFRNICSRILGYMPDITDNTNETCDLVIIGGGYESELPCTSSAQEGLTPYSDDYAIRSFECCGRRILTIVGAGIRSVWYGVYDYFEKYMNCRYFWDGDIIPEAEDLVFDEVNVLKKFRFQYRGQRYFAHRGLGRFQAEMWDIDEWKHEIDWMLKKKLNMFMLRIGLDDIFQRAFPDIVSYPDNNTHWDKDKHDYFDRTSAWSLQYRGELRKMILDYAFERGIMHCEDCGTMTHWYSQTPDEFLEKVKPKFSVDRVGRLASDMAWDTSVPENLANYWKLTDTHIKDFGKAELFHTIGQAERINSNDHDENIEAKIKVFEETEKYIEEHYPDTKLLIASWDFWISFENEDVKKLLDRLNPEISIIFDYTSDAIRYKNFTQWDIIGKFPYIFGIFHAYSRDSDIRGYYNLTEERLAIASKDSSCIGCVMWPETVHTDTFMTEYFAANAADPLALDVSGRLDKFCDDRYGVYSTPMKKLWHTFFPIVNLMSWSMDASGQNPVEMFFLPHLIPQYMEDDTLIYESDFKLEEAYKLMPEAVQVVSMISDILSDVHNDEFIKRDLFDILRTVCGRYIHSHLISYIREFKKWRDRKDADIPAMMNHIITARKLLDELMLILGNHDDFIAGKTLAALSKNRSINPYFEIAFKKNMSCNYHRSYVYESVKMLYIPELEAIEEWTRKNVKNDNRPALKYTDELNLRFKEIRDSYFATPLFDVEGTSNDMTSVCRKIIDIINN